MLVFVCSALFVKLLSISSVTCVFIEVLILSVCLSVLSVSVYINNSFWLGWKSFKRFSYDGVRAQTPWLLQSWTQGGTWKWGESSFGFFWCWAVLGCTLMHTVVPWWQHIMLCFRNVVFGAALGDCIGWVWHSIGNEPETGLFSWCILLQQSHRTGEREISDKVLYTKSWIIP